MRPLTVIRRTPCNDLAPCEFFLLSLHGFMRDIRTAANSARMAPAEHRRHQRSHLNYLVGRLHGHWFGHSSQLLFGGWEYDECERLAYSAISEADFLTGNYLEDA